MPLSDIELRVLGALIEKERTTPEGYPLSSQALVTACNQRTNRDPVTDYHLQDVQAAVARLRDRGLAETIQGVGDRVPKHAHKASGALELDDREAAVFAVLLLRGAQTPGELRARTERYVTFPDIASVERTLAELSDRSAPLVRRLPRGPGQSQDRYQHLLGTDEERLAPRVRRSDGEGDGDGVPRANPSGGGRAAGAARGERTVSGPEEGVPNADALHEEAATLTRRIAELEERVTRLEELLSR